MIGKESLNMKGSYYLHMRDIKVPTHIPKDWDYDWKGEPSKDAKSILQEYCQKWGYSIPEYKEILHQEEIQSHHHYTVAVILEARIDNEDKELYLLGGGRSKKKAGFNAAEKACDIIGLEYKSRGYLGKHFLHIT